LEYLRVPLLNKGDLPYMRERQWKDALAFQPPDGDHWSWGRMIPSLRTGVMGKDFRKDMQQMIDSLKMLPSHPVIYLATPIPAFKPTWNINDSVIVKGINPVIRTLAKKNKCRLMDLHTAYMTLCRTSAERRNSSYCQRRRKSWRSL
jgi:hypothetical protein